MKRSRTERQSGLRSLQVDCESADLFVEVDGLDRRGVLFAHPLLCSLFLAASHLYGVGDELVRRPVIVEGLALLAEIVAQQVLLVADRKNRVRVLAELTLRIKLERISGGYMISIDILRECRTDLRFLTESLLNENEG
ncbi:hypothetical protein [Treponema saccharophilum]|uniref:hypothetical protein n=1 Tax=Treponema saccharophilum TaxID=165 RepID=UPI000592DF96|nr:hypothetical protein [Treponema saccharophilum]